MILVGVAGGVASGKSAVSSRLVTHGAVLLDADRAGHEVLAEPEVRNALRQRWGDAVFDKRGEVDRKQVARRVFADTPAGRDELAFLESWTHPRIGQRLSRQIEALRSQGQIPMAVLDAAVMFKAGWDRLCDRLLFVDCPREVRLARARLRGWDAAEFAGREASQWPLDKKRSRADCVIDNSTTLDHLFAQVDRIWGILVGGDPSADRPESP
jgi:dephospho-CoA kinase